MADVEMADAEPKQKTVSKAPKAVVGDSEGSNKKKFEVKKVSTQPQVFDTTSLIFASGTPLPCGLGT
jgi:hypothetical protein